MTADVGDTIFFRYLGAPCGPLPVVGKIVQVFRMRPSEPVMFEVKLWDIQATLPVKELDVLRVMVKG